MALITTRSGTQRTITAGIARIGGVNRTLLKVQVMHGGVLRTVATLTPDMTVSGNNVDGYGSGNGVQYVTTATSNATITGGRSPFTYAWTLLTNGGGEASVATSPTMGGTTFRKLVSVGVIEVADVWRVTVTDANGSTATAQITARFTNFSTGGFE